MNFSRVNVFLSQTNLLSRNFSLSKFLLFQTISLLCPLYNKIKLTIHGFRHLHDDHSYRHHRDGPNRCDVSGRYHAHLRHDRHGDVRCDCLQKWK